MFIKCRRFYKRLKLFIPQSYRLPLALVPLWFVLAYFAGRIISRGRFHACFEIGLDRSIPFLPWTVVIYLMEYPFWIVNYCLAARSEKSDAYRLFCADFLTECVCFAFFVLLPTMNVRPEISGNGVCKLLMATLYRVDSADNLFPSLHCAGSGLAVVGISGEKSIPVWYRAFSWLMLGAICISTLTTKQHVVIDVLGGLLIAFGAYWISGKPAVQNLYIQMIERIASVRLVRRHK
ncbi:MAG: phosphatase PAP2 family protein [Synergistes sp.]|nr:phosphatase PAP2 family protein [Synergistes sp.]